MKTVFSLTFLMLISLNIFAEKTSTVFSGYIFIDENENGIKDKKEKGLINIPVSNGDTIIKTDKNGFFSISCDNATSLFPVLPSDYELSGGNIKNSLFHFNNDTLNREIFFPVRKTGKTQNHKIAVIGDPQVDNLKQLDYAIRSVYQELTNRDDLDINIFLGDIINEKNDLLPLSRTVIENIGTSSYVACGNHDLDYSIPLNKDSVFNSVFGASTYSFNKGNVHYIVIQNVYSEPSKRNYKGFYTDRQLRFIKNEIGRAHV